MARTPTILGLMLVVAVQAAAQGGTLNPVRDAGQSVSPVYEGWYKNADGTYSLSFGYFNRNAKEVVEVPIGANNFFSPGAQDRGQPAYFDVRRHWGVFAVKVPADFKVGDKVVWTLISRGDTVRIPGHIRPNWQIDAEGEAASGNTPPKVKFAEGGPEGTGPGGIMGPTMTAKVGAPLKLDVWATDDGRTRGSVAGGGRGASVPNLRWFKHTGPGDVTFGNQAPRAAQGTGFASTTATFSAPGDYVLRLRANDGAVASAGHSQCCWSNGFVKVTVTP
jgi:hypothetical protein